MSVIPHPEQRSARRELYDDEILGNI